MKDLDILIDGAVDALLSYAKSPASYNPTKLGLLDYLTMSAYRDVQNALAKAKRRARIEVPVEAVEEQLEDRNTERGETISASPEESVIAAIVTGEMLKTILTVITDPEDRRILGLLLQGEHRTSAFAAVLGLQDSDPKTQRKIVKRHKDRIMKRIHRLGVVIRAQGTS